VLGNLQPAAYDVKFSLSGFGHHDAFIVAVVRR
jgi:hypothetical protein